MPTLNDKTDEAEIQQAVDMLALPWPDVAISKIFGSRAYRAKGVLFAMIGGRGLILTKLDPRQRDAAAEAHDGRPFVGRDKVIPGWTEFRLSVASDLDPLAALVRNAYENALSEAVE